MIYADLLCDWYQINKRDMPWRHTSDPYAIWVSEVMLQQTQVDTVIPYYKRFMKRFPDAKSLAEADKEEVYTLWQGLGYYRRADNLHKGAKMIADAFNGIFPRDPKTALKIPGIGSYTLGAVFSIAFNEPLPAVDGNVMRVLSRQFLISEDIGQPKAKTVFEAVIPKVMGNEPRIFNQAMMELGALICTPQNPSCEQCPMNPLCQAYQEGITSCYPIKSKKTKPVADKYIAVIIQKGDCFWMEKRPEDGLLAGLWAFPLITEAQWHDHCGMLGAAQALKPVKHVFTHRKWELRPYIINQPDDSLFKIFGIDVSRGKYVAKDELIHLAIPTAFRKVSDQL